MAYPFYTPDLSPNIAAAAPHQFYREGQNIFNYEAPLLSMSEVIYGSSDAAYWTASDGGTSWGFVGEGEQVNVSAEFNTPNVLGLSLKRGIARTGFALSNSEIAQVQRYNAAVASNQISDRIKRSWLQSYAVTLNGIERQAFVGTGSAVSVATGITVPGAYGLTYLMNQTLTNGSYAGISLATHPLLKVNLVDCGGASLATHHLDNAFSEILQVAGSVFDGTYFIMGSPKAEQACKAIADTNVNGGSSIRFNADQDAASYNMGARQTPDSRRSRLSYNGVPILANSAMYQAGLDGYLPGVDGYVSGGFLVLASTKDYAIDALPHMPMGMATFEGNEDGVEAFGRVVREIGLPFLYQSYANLGGVYAAFAETEFQFIWGAPNRMCIIYNFALPTS